MTTARHAVPDELMKAFWSYEEALMANDTATLDQLFVDQPDTMRVDPGGLLIGHEEISVFRAGRGRQAPRRIVETHVQVVDPDHAVVLAITELLSGGRGAQTQVWSRSAGWWAIQAAHVSPAPAAFDTRTWRVVGDPLVQGSPEGPLAGLSVAVKDLFAVAGHPIGAGNPTWLRSAEPETRHATVVAALLGAGASVAGITRTDEFAFGLAGTNTHYGSPPNPVAPGHISGGSSSGSASAVAQGQASIGLGTDTGGSIRVPASYCGLWGVRTTHGAVSTDGLIPLARSFDTVGWMTRSADLLARVADVLVPPDTAPAIDSVVIAGSLVHGVDDDVRGTIRGHVKHLEQVRPVSDCGPSFADLSMWLHAFQVVQGREAWTQHGPWLVGRLDTLGNDVRERFHRSRRYSDDDVARSIDLLAEARRTIRSMLGTSTAMLLPSASSTAPTQREAQQGGARLEQLRTQTLQLTCIAGIAGLPAVNIPLTARSGRPVGLCLIGPAGSDHGLIVAATELAAKAPH